MKQLAERELAGKNYTEIFAQESTAVRSGIKPCTVQSSASKWSNPRSQTQPQPKNFTSVLGTKNMRPYKDPAHSGHGSARRFCICRVDLSRRSLYAVLPLLSNRLSCFSSPVAVHICDDSHLRSVWAAPGTCRPTMPTQFNWLSWLSHNRNATGLTLMGGPITDFL